MNVLKHRQLIFTVLLAGLACFNGFKWAWQFSRSPYKPLDFRTYYSGAQTYFNHLNPYDKNELTLSWMQSNSALSEKPNFDVHETVVYAPQFVWYFGLYQLLDYDIAKWLQLALNILALIASAWLVIQLKPEIPKHLIYLAFGAFKGTWFALSNGQPMIQILLLILLSIYLLTLKKHKIIPGVLLGICGYKFTFLIPIGLFLLSQKQFKTFTSLTTTMLLFNGAAILFSAAPETMLHTWQYNLSYLFNYNHVFMDFNGLNIINCSSSVVLKYFIDIPNTSIHLLYTSILLFGSLFCLWFLRQQTGFRILFVLSLLSFCFGQHLMYDILVLMIYWILQYDARKEPVITSLTFAVLCLPLSIVATRLPAIHFIIPICLLIYTLEAIVSDYRLMRNKVTKNAN